LSLQLAADLYGRALRGAREQTPSQLRAAAEAYERAGRLGDASEAWLSLARCTPEPKHAQQFELAAATALLRAGDEERALSLHQGVIRASGVHWPSSPLVTSTVERVRLLVHSHRPRTPVNDSGLRRRRFDALWNTAKELILIAPATGDALAVRG